MDKKQEIGRRIKTMRLSRGMTQIDLANALHCAQSTIAMYETGSRMPDMETVDYLADIFNVPPYAILYSEKEVMPIETKEDEELWQIREDFRRNPELRTIHSLTRNATSQELRQIEALIRVLRSGNEEDTD